MVVPILKQGRYLVISLQDELIDSDWKQLRDDILKRAGDCRSRGALIDISAMDVMDSYATRMLDCMAQMLKLRGTETVVVGIQPGVAFAMSQLGLRLDSAGTALDLDEGLVELRRRTARVNHGR
jgi:rsbT antagonist protein RsbS